MRILVTGNTGGIGRALTGVLRGSGREIRTFDRVARSRDDDSDHHPGDIRDIAAIRRAADRIEAVIHLAAIANDRFGTAEEIFATNVQGTWNVLTACAEAGVGRVIFFSSVNALGNFQGHRATVQFPIDDSYPPHPISPYQLSKHLGEEMCRSFTDRSGMITICLRPVFVTRSDMYEQWTPASREMRETRYRGDYWSYVDIRDVCSAVQLALAVEGVGHDVFLLCARDTMMEEPTADLLDRHYSNIAWPTASRSVWLAADAHRALVDCAHASEILGWRPAFSWRDEAEKR